MNSIENTDETYEYSNSDAWILQTVARASQEKPASLKEIIALGDAINHAMFCAGELQQGLLRLIRNNIIKLEDNLFSLTPQLKKDLSEILSQNMWSIAERKAIAKLIKAKPYSPGEKFPDYDPNAEPLIFSLEEKRKVEKAYHKEFWKEHKRLKALDPKTPTASDKPKQ